MTTAAAATAFDAMVWVQVFDNCLFRTKFRCIRRKTQYIYKSFGLHKGDLFMKTLYLFLAFFLRGALAAGIESESD